MTSYSLGSLLYEGKAKRVFATDQADLVAVEYKDDATAFNAEKKATIEGKGVLNNLLSEYFFTGLNNMGVPTHFMRRLNMREQLVRACEIIAELEPETRGAYAGGVGYFSPDGNMDSCIVLRTGIVKDGMLHVQAGAGIVADSDPEYEQRECEAKAGALMAAAREAVRVAGEAGFGQ